MGQAQGGLGRNGACAWLLGPLPTRGGLHSHDLRAACRSGESGSDDEEGSGSGSEDEGSSSEYSSSYIDSDMDSEDVAEERRERRIQEARVRPWG